MVSSISLLRHSPTQLDGCTGPVTVSMKKMDSRIDVDALIDVGNTFVKVRFVSCECEHEDDDANDTSNKVRCCQISTSEADDLAMASMLRITSGRQRIRRVVLSSVVPRVTGVIRKICENEGISLDIVPNDRECSDRYGMKVYYETPQKLGKDRLAAALAAWDVLEDKREMDAVVVVDAGTAVNIEVIARDGYRGGCILPGLAMMMSSLSKGTAQLNTCEKTMPARAVGRCTSACIRSGVCYGFLGAVKNVLEEVADDLKETESDSCCREKKIFVVATGGDGPFLMKHMPEVFDAHRPNIVLDGLGVVRRMLSGGTKAH